MLLVGTAKNWTTARKRATKRLSTALLVRTGLRARSGYSGLSLFRDLPLDTSGPARARIFSPPCLYVAGDANHLCRRSLP
jgi:hypothetical protein